MHRHAIMKKSPPTQLLMACLGDASRFRLVQALIGGPRCVTDLAIEVGLSQSCTTRHLQALERRNVVLGTRDGKRVLYRLCSEDPDLRTLLSWALPSESTPDVASLPGRMAPSKTSRRRQLEETAEALIRFAAVSVQRGRSPALAEPGRLHLPRLPKPADRVEARSSREPQAIRLVKPGSRTPASSTRSRQPAPQGGAPIQFMEDPAVTVPPAGDPASPPTPATSDPPPNDSSPTPAARRRARSDIEDYLL